MTTPPRRFGVLLLHGFTGNPDTMRPLKAPREALGVEVSQPLMRGHGAASPQALQGVTWADWLADGSAALAELATRVDRVILIGHSMGALVALQLAADHNNCGDQLDSLVLLATPLQLASPLAPGRPLAWLRPLLGRLLRRWPLPKLYTDPQLGDNDTSYPWAPMVALLSLLAFIAATSQRLHQVSLPALILQSHGDPTVLDASAVTLLSGLGTPAADKRVVWLQRSGHELLQDVDRVAVIEAVVGFVGGRMQRQRALNST
jgi:carboxylesterase